MFAKIKMFMIIGVVMAVEAAGFLFLIPQTPPAEAATTKAVEAPKNAEIVEFDLGKFVVNNVSDPAVVIKVDLQVYAEVKQEAQDEFKGIFEKKKFRIKESVTTVVRRAKNEVLQEPNLSTLKRQLKESVLDIVGRDKELISGVIVPEFKTTEM